MGNQEMVGGHTADCPVHEDGPCVCGTEDMLVDLAREEAEYFAND